MLYHLYELNQAALRPARAAAEAYRLLFRNPLNPAYHTPLGRSAAHLRWEPQACWPARLFPSAQVPQPP